MSAMDKLIEAVRVEHEERCPVCGGEVNGPCEEGIRQRAMKLYRAVVDEYEGTLT